jgi:lipopolysaccharide transport system ATP-binding protein
MNLRTAFNPEEPTTNSRPVVQLKGVSVLYSVPQERIPSIKEYAIRWLKRQIKYQKFWALRDVTLDISQGEVFGIIGPNGAGKSTMLKVIARVLRPTQGAVQVRGLVAPLLELGAGFDTELTGRENIYLNGAILGFSKHNLDQRIDRIIDFAGLHEFIDAPLRTYSTGMVARLGFAVATDVRPDILIVDEILSVGDTDFQNRSYERIQNFQAEGTTILLVSHNMGKVEEMCSRVLWLERGEVQGLGSTKSVVERYLGRIRMNESQRLAQESTLEGNRRWGTGKIEIERVRILDEYGAEKYIFKNGEKLILEMDYIAHHPISSPIFGIAIHRQDGVHITGPNTGFAGMDPGFVTGRGSVVYTIPHLPFLEGLYHFSVAASNRDDTELFDYHDRIYSFRVVKCEEATRERYGLMALRGEWQFRPAPVLGAPVEGE